LPTCRGKRIFKIDGDVQELPADATGAALSSTVTGDAVADAADAAERLGVDVDQFARPLALVADDSAQRIERREPAETETAQRDANRGDRLAELAGDGRAREALAPQCRDLGLCRC